MSVRKGDSVIAGNQVLYSTTGQHIDGAMTQKAATDSFLNVNQISNCITEIPQDIKLELNNGTLTLKAGSKAYKANGVNSWLVVNITSDTIINNSWGSANTGMLFYSMGSGYNFYPFERIHSGATNPTGLTGNSHVNYNTSDGRFYYTINAGSSWNRSSNGGLPLACVTWSADNKITSIDQVFNGFGYIGSTVFVLPGLSVLAPNGRNADGTLKNISWTGHSVITRTESSSSGRTYLAINTIQGLFGMGQYQYDEVDNYNKLNGVISEGRCVVAQITNTSGGVITNFTPKNTFHALDYNDSEYIANCAMPSGRYIDLTLGTSGSSYTAPADGWFFLGKKSSNANQYISLSGGTAYRIIAPSSDQELALSLPVRKGASIKIWYNAGGETSYFRFVYAEGAQ